MLLLIVHAAATWVMVGVILFVQVVHYPLFFGVGGTGFARYEQSHVRRTSIVVMPFMLLELTTLVMLLLYRPAAPGGAWLGFSALLLAVVWISTFVLQVPCHRRLEAGFDVAAVRRLVATNWLRTVAWVARGVVVAIALRLGVPSGDAI